MEKENRHDTHTDARRRGAPRRVADQNGLAPEKALTALLNRALADAEAETKSLLPTCAPALKITLLGAA